MWGVYVIPAYRGTGTADRLVATGLDWVRSLGLRRILAHVAAPNGRALGFYRRLGFTIGPVTDTLRPGSTIPVHDVTLDLAIVTPEGGGPSM